MRDSVNSFFKEKRVLVTGACGTVSRELVRQLLEDVENRCDLSPLELLNHLNNIWHETIK